MRHALIVTRTAPYLTTTSVLICYGVRTPFMLGVARNRGHHACAVELACSIIDLVQLYIAIYLRSTIDLRRSLYTLARVSCLPRKSFLSNLVPGIHWN